MIPRGYRYLIAIVALLVGLAFDPSQADAQVSLRRSAPLQPVALARKGDLLIGIGGAYEADVHAPLVSVDGDLARVAVVHLLYAVADGVLLEVRGDPYQVLNVDSLGVPIIEPDESPIGGSASGAADFRAAVSFLLFGDDQGLAAGGRFEFNLPDSDESKGLGTNSLNIRFGVLGAFRRGPLVFTADVGFAILEAPVDNFEQNDVLAYSAELLYSTALARPLRLYLGVDGRASTRSSVPLGTEDLGTVRFGADLRLGRWLLDAGGLVGYAGNSASWGLTGGAAFLLGRRRGPGGDGGSTS